MENVSDWILYHSDVSDNPGDFREEDLLARYQRRRSIKSLNYHACYLTTTEYTGKNCPGASVFPGDS